MKNSYGTNIKYKNVRYFLEPDFEGVKYIEVAVGRKKNYSRRILKNDSLILENGVEISNVSINYYINKKIWIEIKEQEVVLL